MGNAGSKIGRTKQASNGIGNCWKGKKGNICTFLANPSTYTTSIILQFIAWNRMESGLLPLSQVHI